MAQANTSTRGAETHSETLRSVLCAQGKWTPDSGDHYQYIAFSEDGVGCLQLINDQPGFLLVCEFEWEISGVESDSDVSADTPVDTRQKDLEDSLRTRGIAQFYLTLKLRRNRPRKEWGFEGTVDFEAALARRLKDEAFDDEQFLIVDLEVGNFTPDHDLNASTSGDFGRTRYALRLAFRTKSPVPSLDLWKEEYRLMAESQAWEGRTSWFRRKVHGTGIDGWKFEQ